MKIRYLNIIVFFMLINCVLSEDFPLDLTEVKISKTDESRMRWEKEEQEAKDIKLNKIQTEKQIYYNRNIPKLPLELQDLKDSDADGYDDYTEYMNGTDWTDPNDFPIIRNGNNKKIFK